MTRYLDRWGFDAIAADINTDAVDGLRAGQKFIDEGAHFLRVRAGMEKLPFAPGHIRLLVNSKKRWAKYLNLGFGMSHKRFCTKPLLR